MADSWREFMHEIKRKEAMKREARMFRLNGTLYTEVEIEKFLANAERGVRASGYFGLRAAAAASEIDAILRSIKSGKIQQHWTLTYDSDDESEDEDEVVNACKDIQKILVDKLERYVQRELESQERTIRWQADVEEGDARHRGGARDDASGDVRDGEEETIGRRNRRGHGRRREGAAVGDARGEARAERRAAGRARHLARRGRRRRRRRRRARTRCRRRRRTLISTRRSDEERDGGLKQRFFKKDEDGGEGGEDVGGEKKVAMMRRHRAAKQMVKARKLGMSAY